ncbi:MAG: hypothetical protein RH862_04040 [Leptospiraceae bacterium]
MAFFQKIGRMLQEDFSPPFDGFFFLKLLLYLAFFTFCLRLFGGGSCIDQAPEGRIILGPTNSIPAASLQNGVALADLDFPALLENSGAGRG